MTLTYTLSRLTQYPMQKQLGFILCSLETENLQASIHQACCMQPVTRAINTKLVLAAGPPQLSSTCLRVTTGATRRTRGPAVTRTSTRSCEARTVSGSAPLATR